MSANPEQDRETWRELLWQLKQRLDVLRSEDMGHVSFRLLLNNPAYRQAVLKRAEGLRDRQVHALLLQIRRLPRLDDGAGEHAVRQASGATGSMLEIEERLRQGSGNEAGEVGTARTGRWRLVAVFLLLVVVLAGAAFGGLYALYRWTNRVQHVATDISRDTVWHKGTTYVLDDVVYVTGKARLRIEPGVVVKGRAGSALVVTRHARLEARGTRNEPIVFTSARQPGTRRPGDWGGVVLLGDAPTNQGVAQIEGLDEDDPRGAFGGTDPTANCGLLEYVRIEFAGYEAYVDNELNGLTLGGCGSATTIRHVQVHRALDDGIEVFGGRVDFRNVLITGPGDDGFDWDMGWQGRVQFLVVHQYPGRGDNGFEGDNDARNPDARPRSLPRFENVTLIANRAPESAHRAMTVRRGSGGRFGHFIIMGHTLEAIDLRGKGVAELIASGKLRLRDSLLYQIGPDGRSFFASEAGHDDDGGVEEAEVFARPAWNNHLGANPGLPVEAYSLRQPDYAPRADGLAARIGGRLPEGEFWDESARFAGAVRPGHRTRNWLSGWTAFPES